MCVCIASQSHNSFTMISNALVSFARYAANFLGIVADRFDNHNPSIRIEIHANKDNAIAVGFTDRLKDLSWPVTIHMVDHATLQKVIPEDAILPDLLEPTNTEAYKAYGAIQLNLTDDLSFQPSEPYLVMCMYTANNTAPHIVLDRDVYRFFGLGTRDKDILYESLPLPTDSFQSRYERMFKKLPPGPIAYEREDFLNVTPCEPPVLPETSSDSDFWSTLLDEAATIAASDCKLPSISDALVIRRDSKAEYVLFASTISDHLIPVTSGEFIFMVCNTSDQENDVSIEIGGKKKHSFTLGPHEKRPLLPDGPIPLRALYFYDVSIRAQRYPLTILGMYLRDDLREKMDAVKSFKSLLS